MINDSGNRTKFESGAVRDIQEGKGRCDLLPLDIIDLWCDDGLKCTLYYVGEYLKHKGSKDSFLFALDHFAAEHQAKRIASGEDDKMITLDQYKWNLVLEVAKHFEEGAKKYGDRNWEKGIPCDRYIDSAVRHYCKWRACWTDEPHDRAFIWNILCCEWTRRQYGWNLERLGDLADKLTRNEIMSSNEFRQILGLVPSKDPGADELRNKMGSGDFKEKAHKLGDPVIPMLSLLLDYKLEDESESKKFFKLGEQMSQALNDCVNMVDNPYVKGMDDGWKFYSVDGRLLGYIFKFEEPSEQKRRQLDIMVKKVWHEVTDNVYTMKRIIEERGYTCGRDFSICVAPSEIAKEYDFKNRKYNEEN